MFFFQKMESTQNTPSQQQTPKKKRKIDGIDVTCSIVNVSNLMMSPSKPGRSLPVRYSHFGTITNDSEKIFQSVTFDPRHLDFFNSADIKGIVNNPTKAIHIKNVQRNDNGGFKLTAESQFGDVIDLTEAYTVMHPAISSIFDVIFKMELGTFTSIEGLVTQMDESFSSKQKKKIYTVKVIDNAKRSISVSAFIQVPVKKGIAYTFHNVIVETYNQERILRYDTTSAVAVSNKKFKGKTDSPKQIIKISKMKAMQTSGEEKNCPSCQTEIAVDEEQFFECGNCGTCGEYEEDIQSYFLLTVTHMDSTKKEAQYQLSQKLMDSSVSSNKELIVNKWSVEVRDNEILSLEKA